MTHDVAAGGRSCLLGRPRAAGGQRQSRTSVLARLTVAQQRDDRVETLGNRGVMKTLRLSTVAAVSAISLVVCFVLGVAAMASSGVEMLIPETGRPGREWIADVDAAGGLFFAGAWLIILMGFLGVVAFVGFYDALREAGPVMILAPILGPVGLTLATVSHLIPIAMAYELVPAFAATALVTNAAVNFLGWGVVVPLYAVAILTTRAVPRWIGWLGLLVGLTLGITVNLTVVFMLSMGVALLRRPAKVEGPAPVPTY